VAVGDPEGVRLLLELGADPNQTDPAGRTPLALAIHRRTDETMDAKDEQ
jgi:ankyrin repeat protein